MALTPEGRVKAAVKKWLSARNIWFYMPVQNGMGVTGIPGKRANLSTNQHRQISGIHQAGGAAIVVDDVSQLDALA